MKVKILCLGILQLGDASGYEIRKMTPADRFSHFVDASYGAIHPALAGLERDGPRDEPRQALPQPTGPQGLLNH